MLKVNKEQEPDFLLEYKKRYSPKSWTDYNKDDIKAKIKENILIIEQEEFCPYCEKRIYTNDDGHIEHIKPRDVYPKEFQLYNNILVSCNEKNSCGMHKKNNYNDKFINPVIDNPKDYFDYNIANGEIIPKNNNEESNEYVRASYTIDTLNLNSYQLKEARKSLIDILDVYRENYDEYNEYLQFFLDDGHNFPSLIKLYMEL
ncbi:retron system putative HNH endonuclease [Clostridium sp. CMCC3677]|uniref:retron system putative HNH endonuclease n=1 Tax=Clostridium sp. CMCC3677 TaxID=2949963 RepID=UPI0013F0F10E|nr:retron system putative HNH endonuclease [Clostridium sp. CMCC3677]NFG61516.1 TIGR02646 family protein [Clostridium botulinum]NFQ10689.1 TIGR02646 family protein [Clostridium botulinum]